MSWHSITCSFSTPTASAIRDGVYERICVRHPIQRSNRLVVPEPHTKSSDGQVIPTPGKDSCRIVTDAPALALEVGQDPSSVRCWIVLISCSASPLATEGAVDQKRQHDVVALAFQATPNSSQSRQRREYVMPLSEFSAPLPRMPAKENVDAGGHNRV